MADRPIIFSAPMVRAILREIDAPGTGKTQTRRVQVRDMGHAAAVDNSAGRPIAIDQSAWDRRWPIRTPCAPGDRLWVRETWLEYSKGEAWYRADHLETTFKWRASSAMPRWASRLTLTVTDVRVQRLQDISGDDARAEGIEQVYDPGADDDAPAYLDYRIPDHAFAGFGAARLSFSTLWDDLNTKPGTGWADNPWVAAISFTPRLGNIDGEGA